MDSVKNVCYHCRKTVEDCEAFVHKMGVLCRECHIRWNTEGDFSARIEREDERYRRDA